MPAESISVVYQPVVSFVGLTAYHETLVYTDASGNQHFATAGASTPEPGGSSLSNISQASSAVASGTTSVYGTLQVVNGSVADLSNPEHDRMFGPPNAPFATQVLTTSSDLSGQWQSILNTENYIASQNLAYSPLTQNSNSVANTALTAAGLQPPDTAFFSGHWAPASGNLLQTPTTSGSDNQTTSVTTDAAGNTTVTITEKDSTGSTSDSITLNSNANGNTIEATLTGGNGTFNRTEAVTINSEGSQTDNLQSLNADGSVRLSLTIDSANVVPFTDQLVINTAFNAVDNSFFQFTDLTNADLPFGMEVEIFGSDGFDETIDPEGTVDVIDDGTGSGGGDPVIQVNGHAPAFFFHDGDFKIVAGDGNDSVDLRGSTGNNTLIAGNGNDVIAGGGGSNVIIAGDGNDVIQTPFVQPGTPGSNFIKVGNGNDTITVRGLDSTIVAGGGLDTINGGPGNDIISVGANLPAGTILGLSDIIVLEKRERLLSFGYDGAAAGAQG